MPLERGADVWSFKAFPYQKACGFEQFDYWVFPVVI